MGFWGRERRERVGEEREEELPSPRGVAAFQVVLDEVRRLLDEFYSKPRSEPWKQELFEPLLVRGIDEARIHVASRLRMLPQSTLTTVNKKTLKNSTVMILISCLTVLESRVLSARGEIESIVEAIRSGSVQKSDIPQLVQRLKELSFIVLGSLYALPFVIKDIDGLVNINLPFHLASDLIRKNIGYSATS